MRRFLYIICLLMSGAIFAVEELKNPFQEIKLAMPGGQDFVRLRDGTNLTGFLETLPSLPYSFGKVNLDLRDIAMVSFCSDLQDNQVKYATREGHCFIGILPKENFTFWQNTSSEATPKLVKKELKPDEISYIVLKSRGRNISPIQRKPFQLNLRDGTQLVVTFNQDSITVSNGKKTKDIPAESISYLIFDGGLYGEILEKGCPKKLDFAFAKNKYLAVQICHTGDAIKFPWEKIAAIRVSEPKHSRIDKKNSEIIDKIDSTDPLAADPLTSSNNAPQSEVLSQKETPTEHPGEEVFEVLLLTLNERIKEKEENLNPSLDKKTWDRRDSPSKLIRRMSSALIFESLNSQPASVAPSEEIAFTSPDERGEALLEKSEPFLPQSSSELTPFREEPFSGTGEGIFYNLSADQKIFSTQDPNFGEEMNPYSPSEQFFLDEDALAHPWPQQQLPPLPSEVAPHHIEGMTYISTGHDQLVSDVKGFYISAMPITNEEYMQFITATNYRCPSHWIQGNIPRGLEKEPVVNVSYHDALTYAVWSGKRLPTEKEWLRAEQRGFFPIKHPFNEWTSTSFYADELPERPKELGFSKLSLGHPRYKAVHGHRQRGPMLMYKDDKNHQTGFRLALDAAQ